MGPLSLYEDTTGSTKTSQNPLVHLPLGSVSGSETEGSGPEEVMRREEVLVEPRVTPCLLDFIV